jgi:hypothetical protein
MELQSDCEIISAQFEIDFCHFGLVFYSAMFTAIFEGLFGGFIQFISLFNRRF